MKKIINTFLVFIFNVLDYTLDAQNRCCQNAHLKCVPVLLHKIFHTYSACIEEIQKSTCIKCATFIETNDCKIPVPK